MDFYSYNGVELPALPEWDKETYPYALIYTDISKCTYFVMAKSWSTPETTAHYLNCRYALVSELTDGAWGEIKKAPFGDVGVERTALVWANSDIYMSDGALYFAASKPIPTGYGIISLADYEAACDAIRAKTGKTDLIKSAELKHEVESIPSYITVATEEEATDTTTIPIVEGQVIIVTGA